MKSVAAFLALIAALIFAPSLASPAQAQPCQWQYDLVPQSPAGTATATYCGNVNVKGTINVNVGPNVTQTISSLEGLTTFTPGALVTVLGYNSAGDGGGGQFLLVSGTTPDDLCMNFHSAVANTHWVRQLNGQPLSALKCGAFNNNTNPTQTQLSLQAGITYIQASANPNAPFYIEGGTYNCGSALPACMQTNAANWCPNIYGDGNGNTIINYTPTAEGTAFLFNSAIGNCNNGGVRNLRVTGNAMTIGCQALSTNNGYCDIQVVGVFEQFLMCSCTSGGFSENWKLTANIGSSFTQRLLEYRVNSGGTGSFRESGLICQSYIEANASNVNALIYVGAGAQVYSAPMCFSFNNQSNAARTILDNQSSIVPSTYGNIQLEIDGTSTTQIAKNGSWFIGGTVQLAQGGSANLIYGSVLFTQIGGQGGGGVNTYKTAYQVLESAPSVVQYLGAGTGVTTTITVNFPPSTTAIYDLLLYGGNTWTWNGQVMLRADTLGDCDSGVIGGTLFKGTGGNPTFAGTISGSACVLRVTVPGTIPANTVKVLGTVSMSGAGL